MLSRFEVCRMCVALLVVLDALHSSSSFFISLSLFYLFFFVLVFSLLYLSCFASQVLWTSSDRWKVLDYNREIITLFTWRTRTTADLSLLRFLHLFLQFYFFPPKV